MRDKDETILILEKTVELLQVELAAAKIELKRHDQVDQQKDQKIGELQKEVEELKQQVEILNRHIKDLCRDRFGSKGERYTEQPNPISSETVLIPIPPDQQDATIEIATHKRKRGGRNSLKNLPRREIIIPVSPEDKICSCGKEKQVIGYETNEIINYEPAVYEIIVEKREKVACTCGCSDCSITVAPKPEHILPKSKVSESFLANIIVSKMLDRQPLYHIEKILQSRYGIKITRNTMARWVIDSSHMLQPLVNFFQDEILSYPIAAMDATSLQVLKEEGRKAQTKSYVYCIRGGPPDKKSTVYEYNAVLHKIFLGSWFDGYKGKIHCDAGNVFDDLGETPDILLSYCNAHARRKFEPIAKEAQEAGGSDGAADYAMRVFQKLYMIERYAKIKEMDPEQRKILRQEKSKPLMLEFRNWLGAVYGTLLPKAPLGNAVAYCINHWEGLTRFLDDGYLEIDNNLTEQAIKPFVIARKNFLFACSVDGARALCIHFSLIRTALLHNLDPYEYYVSLFGAIPSCKTAADYEGLLPWNIKLNKVRLAA
ncbi:conserved hypothetical protein [Gammaproteobacteria bacterium]